MATARYEPPKADLRLVSAAEREDWAAVLELLQKGITVNLQGPDGSTALLWAAHNGSPGVVRSLIAAGAEPSRANQYGISPLLEACRHGNAAIALVLLSAGANPSQPGPERETPLMAASATGNLQIVQQLIARGVDVNAKERVQHQTALMWASEADHMGVVRALLAAGADPNAIARPNSLPRVGRLDAGRMWVDHSSGGLSSLMFAVRQGRLDVAGELVKAGANLNYANPDGITALMIAVINDRLDIAGMLLESGANPNDGSLYETVLLHNLRVNSTAGDATRPRPAHENRTTPLDIMAKLLAAGADPERLASHTLHIDGTGTPGPVRNSALRLALTAEDVAALRLFLAKGADPNRLLDNGATPLMAVIEGGGPVGGFGFGVPPGAYRYLDSHDPIDAVGLLLDAGADVKAVTASGDTAMHSAAQAGNLAVIRLLADRGSSVTAKDNAGLTPLDFAMGKRPPGANIGRPRAGGPEGRGGGPKPEAAALLRQLMGLREEHQ
jgi:ankyrin repeat protein